jgi:hypothetical protein
MLAAHDALPLSEKAAAREALAEMERLKQVDMLLPCSGVQSKGVFMAQYASVCGVISS